MSSFLYDHFWKTYSPKARKSSSDTLLKKYPDKLPVIVFPADKKGIPKIQKNKFLVPKDITLGRFMVEVRNSLDLTEIDSNKTIFLFIDNQLVMPLFSKTMEQIYASHCDEDGFLYICYCDENTFGKK